MNTRKYAERDNNVYTDYQAGMSYADLATKYNTKLGNAKVIVYNQKKRLGLLPKKQYKAKVVKQQKYIIVIAELKDIEKAVAEKMKQGYHPTGNIFEVRTSLFTTKVAQPMLKS